MRIDQVVGQGKPTISFEFFPPKNEAGFAALYKAIDELHPLHPTYVSVTYGAGGSTRQKTVELVAKIQNELKIRAMAHLTCVGHTAEELSGILDDLWRQGIVNVLALRGDPPQGQSTFVKTEGGFANADELVSFARGRHDFCIGVAGIRRATRSALTSRATWNTSSARSTTAGASSLPSSSSTTRTSTASATGPARWASRCRSLPGSCRS